MPDSSSPERPNNARHFSTRHAHGLSPGSSLGNSHSKLNFYAEQQREKREGIGGAGSVLQSQESEHLDGMLGLRDSIDSIKRFYAARDQRESDTGCGAENV